MLAQELHRDAIVIDSCGPDGPAVYTPEMLARLDEASTAGEAVEAVGAMTSAALLRGELGDFWEGWDRSGVDVSCLTVGVDWGPHPFTYESAVRELARYLHLFDMLENYEKVVRADDAERVHGEGKAGILLAFQNTTHFGDDLGALERFYELGVRVIQLTYNTRNLVGDGCTERDPSGLSHFGVEVVKRMNELGIIVDVSHCSEPTSFDAVSVSDEPVAITHAFARAVHDHDRGRSDELIKAVGTEGYVGVALVPFFLTSDPRPTLDHFIAHVEHIAEIVGIDHVGIGSDWSPEFAPQLVRLLNEEVGSLGFRKEHRVDFGARIEGLDSWADWPKVTEALVARGFSDDEVRGLVGGNFLRLFREVVG